MRHILALLAAGPVGLALLAHCGGSDGGGGGGGQGGAAASGAVGGDSDSSTTGGTSGSSAGGSSGSQTGGSSGTGATSGSGGSATGGTGGFDPDAGLADVQFQYDATEPDAKICVDETVAAEPVPLDIYFMLDASTSMSSPAGSGAAGDCNAAPPFAPTVNSRWCRAVNAIAGYVSSPEAVNNRAAIQYFQVYSGHDCPGTAYAVPSVGLGLLTGSYAGHAQALVETTPGGINWAYPFSGTPTEPALRGLAQFTAANKTPGRIIIGILVTDGNPGGLNACSTSDTVLASIAANHFNATGIHTFMVGITGANFARLETWGNYPGALVHDDANDACGTCNGCTCHHYNVGDGSPAVFIAALKAIQNAVLSCSFQVPKPTTGVLNPDAVKVEYYPGGNPPPTELPKVAGAAQCTGPGWYFEYNASNEPTTIHLCPASCTTVQADVNAEVKIRIACAGS